MEIVCSSYSSLQLRVKDEYTFHMRLRVTKEMTDAIIRMRYISRI